MQEMYMLYLLLPFVLLAIPFIIVGIIYVRFRKAFYRFLGSVSQHGNADDTKQQQKVRKTKTKEGVIITDMRNPEQANRKIFTKEEGEYVPFEEKP